MDRKEFEKWTKEQRAEFVNKRLDNKSLDEIAKHEFGRSASWLSKKLAEDGYHKERNGRFHYEEKKQISEQSVSFTNGFEELFKHKDTLIALAQKIENDGHINPDFSVLNEYKGEDHRFSVTLKKSLNEELESLSKRVGIPKSSMIALAIHHLIQNYK